MSDVTDQAKELHQLDDRLGLGGCLPALARSAERLGALGYWGNYNHGRSGAVIPVNARLEERELEQSGLNTRRDLARQWPEVPEKELNNWLEARRMLGYAQVTGDVLAARKLSKAVADALSSFSECEETENRLRKLGKFKSPQPPELDF